MRMEREKDADGERERCGRREREKMRKLDDDAGRKEGGEQSSHIHQRNRGKFSVLAVS